MVSWPWSLDAGHDYKPPSSQRAALGYLVPMWQEYLLHGHGTPLLALQFALEQDACAVVDYGDLVRGSEDLAQLVHDDPLLALRSLRAAVHAQLPDLLMPRNESTLTIGRYGRSLHRISARELLREHINRLVGIHGVVNEATAISAYCLTAVYLCGRCACPVPIQSEDGSLPTAPTLCIGRDRGGCGQSGGKSHPFVLAEELCVYDDVCYLHIQDPPEDLQQATVPRSVLVQLRGPFARNVTVGSRVTVHGALRVRRPRRQDRRAMEYWLDALWLQADDARDDVPLTPEEETRLREIAASPVVYDELAACVAPGLEGLALAKLAVMVQMFSAPPTLDGDGNQERGDIHVLLVGPPGTGKSALLRWAATVHPKGIITAATGATKVGLTAAIEKDEVLGGWSISGGALALADRGHASIDELDKLAPEHAEGLLTAMEEQVIHIDKASVHVTINSRCSVLAAANPTSGRFEHGSAVSLAEQTGLPPTLLDRFDIIVPVDDVPDATMDGLQIAAMSPLNRAKRTGPHPPELIRRYLQLARAIDPVFTPAAVRIISEEFVRLRQAGQASGVVSITKRQGRSMYRLSQALARMQLSAVVKPEHAERAIGLVVNHLVNVASRGDGVIDVTRIYASPRNKLDKDALVLRVLDEHPDSDMAALVRLSDLPQIDVGNAISRLESLGKVYQPRTGQWRAL